MRQQKVHSLCLVRTVFITKRLSFHHHLLEKGSVRTATKRAGGTVRNHGGSPGKRLGLKKFSGTSFPLIFLHSFDPTLHLDQHVIPGNIIVRQRGTQFHPGQNVFNLSLPIMNCPLFTFLQVRMGRDHTIYATTPGFVRFYKQKWLRGDRKFVGVVLHRGEKLPRDETVLGRSRYFGLVDLAALSKSSPSSHTNA